MSSPAPDLGPSGQIAQRRIVNPLEARDLLALENERTPIVSVAPFSPLQHYGQGGFLEIPALPADKRFLVYPIQGWVAYYSFGNDQFHPKLVSSLEWAMDVVRRVAHFGLFLPSKLTGTPRLVSINGHPFWEDVEPDEAELVAAEVKLDEYMAGQAAEADKWWPRKRNPALVSDHARMYARKHKLTREWATGLAPAATCLACAGAIEGMAIICPKCRHPRDWQKAFELGLLDAEQERRGLARGLIVDAAMTGTAPVFQSTIPTEPEAADGALGADENEPESPRKPRKR